MEILCTLIVNIKYDGLSTGREKDCFAFCISKNRCVSERESESQLTSYVKSPVKFLQPIPQSFVFKPLLPAALVFMLMIIFHRVIGGSILFIAAHFCYLPRTVKVKTPPQLIIVATPGTWSETVLWSLS